MEEARETLPVKEGEKDQREIVIHFIRHGEASYVSKDDIEGELTERGREQARQAALALFNQLKEGEIIGFYSSPRKRAQETAEEIRQEIERLCQEGKRIIVVHSPKTPQFRRLSIDDQLTHEWIELARIQKQDPIDFWLKNPGESSEKIENNFRTFLSKFSGLASRLLPVGPNIHLVCITHTGPSEVFVGRLLGSQHPGNLANCEEFTIKLATVKDKHPILEFKGREQVVDPNFAYGK